jgi:hypothetical protein
MCFPCEVILSIVLHLAAPDIERLKRQNQTFAHPAYPLEAL